LESVSCLPWLGPEQMRLLCTEGDELIEAMLAASRSEN